jgi:nucleoside-diphosphate-sugar epimerase
MILIIGGGFISSHLTKRLDDLGKEFKLIHHGEKETGSYSQVYFLSAYGNLFDQTNDQMMLEANIYDLYQRLKEIQYDKFIHISTSSVTLPVQTMYSATKACGEKICEGFAQTHNKKIISVRPATVIGKNEYEGHLIPTLIRSCKTGEEIPFINEPTHDFIDVRDFVDALIFVTNKMDGVVYEVVEVGRGKSISNKKVKETVEKAVGKKANVKLVGSLRPYDNANWKVDSSVLLNMGWRPKYTLEETIQSMV